jgi:hypothetical protein
MIWAYDTYLGRGSGDVQLVPEGAAHGHEAPSAQAGGAAPVYHNNRRF